MDNFKLSGSGCLPEVTFEPMPGFFGAKVTKMKVHFTSAEKAFCLEFTEENGDAYSVWAPLHCTNRAVYPSWINQLTVESKATHGMPLLQYINKADENICTFALSDASVPVRIYGGIDERSSRLLLSVEFFTEPTDDSDTYEVLLYCDTSRRPYYESLSAVRSFWSEGGYSIAAVPPEAKRSLFSTWYCFQKAITAEKVFEQCMLAKKMGMNTVIVDDGWQTPCNGGGDQWKAYFTCGDWEPYPGKFPDMAGFVRRLHEQQMKVVLWVALPFIGSLSKDFDLFRDKLLRVQSGDLESGALTIPDPRYPAVRQWYVKKLTGLLQRYDLDGFKLDFIDHFYYGDEPKPFGDGMDIPHLQTAADALLREITTALHEKKSSLMIEFRQPYIGSVMQRYGNMFRVDDRAYGAMYNRVNSIDLRLVTHGTAIHSDMLMWDPKASAEAAADQLSALLFCVPQISMPLERLSEEHYKMLAFYLNFIDSNRDVLQEGKLVPLYPEALYPAVYAEKNGCVVAGLYETESFTVPEGAKTVKIVNATGRNQVLVSLPGEKSLHYRIVNCMGEEQESGEANGSLFRFAVPHNGVLFLD